MLWIISGVSAPYPGFSEQRFYCIRYKRRASGGGELRPRHPGALPPLRVADKLHRFSADFFYIKPWSSSALPGQHDFAGAKRRHSARIAFPF